MNLFRIATNARRWRQMKFRIELGLDLLGGLTIPLLLVSLGVALARMKVTSLGRALALSLSNPIVAGVSALAVLGAGLLLAWLRPRATGSALTRKGVRHVDLLGF